MEKLKEIAYLLIDGVSAIARLLVAVVIPFCIAGALLRYFTVMEKEGIPFAEQLIISILMLWVVDILMRPVISRLLLNSLSDLGKLLIILPPEKKEEIIDARCTTATAKDA
ncbi:hypothetical protein ACQQ6W_23345 [Lysinibacillus fusiformis]